MTSNIVFITWFYKEQCMSYNIYIIFTFFVQNDQDGDKLKGNQHKLPQQVSSPSCATRTALLTGRLHFKKQKSYSNRVLMDSGIVILEETTAIKIERCHHRIIKVRQNNFD